MDDPQPDADGPGHVRGGHGHEPATPLHLPPAHEISATGVTDDHYHTAFRNPSRLETGTPAKDLFAAAESALKAQGSDACNVV